MVEALEETNKLMLKQAMEFDVEVKSLDKQEKRLRNYWPERGTTNTNRETSNKAQSSWTFCGRRIG